MEQNNGLDLVRIKGTTEIEKKYSTMAFKHRIMKIIIQIMFLLIFTCPAVLGKNNSCIQDGFEKVEKINKDNDSAIKCRECNIDCSNLKTGRFEMVDSVNGIALITRTKDFQVEEDKKLGLKIKFQINWIANCTYTLKPVAILLNSNNMDLPRMTITCRIISIDKDSYTEVSSSNITSMTLKSKVIIIK